jgi:hydroxylaminobenzene mutase
MDQITGRRIKQLGMLLFFFGLITGLVMTNFKNVRMGLAAHLEGVMNGIFLLAAGLIWKELNISESLKKITGCTLIYGTFVNWIITLLAAVLGTSKMTPVTGQGFTGSAIQENIVDTGFITVGLAMIFSLAVLIYGLRGKEVIIVP